MRILLVRHGESEGNVNPEAYFKGDNQVCLSERGWNQAYRGLGKFLPEFYQETNTQKWPTVYLSSYTRPKQTFAGAYRGGLKDIFPGDPVLRENIFLTEKFFGAANHLYHPPEHLSDFDKKVWKALLHLSQQVYKADPFKAPNLFGESTFNTLVAIKLFIDGTFARARAKGRNDILLVCHGAVIQAFLMTWAHLQMSDKGKLGNPGNCDVIKIEGEEKNWTFQTIWDGEKMERCDRDALNGLKPFSVADLPGIPQHLLEKGMFKTVEHSLLQQLPAPPPLIPE